MTSFKDFQLNLDTIVDIKTETSKVGEKKLTKKFRNTQRVPFVPSASYLVKRNLLWILRQKFG